MTEPKGKTRVKTLYVGGARSGKSRLALAATERHEGPLHYLATAQAFDVEMTERITLHQAERDARWQTIECPLDLPQAIARISTGAILVDCLTLWLSNMMLGDYDVETGSQQLIAAIRQTKRPLVVVSNEVGMGIVPEYPLGRVFRDAAGRLNQLVAAETDAALFVIAGLVIPLQRPWRLGGAQGSGGFRAND